ncbi:MAG: hypothetical protein KAR13_09025 [Desulfobulbaceae bacterium]|nr:hypothetical protein [Desulfobulbaceae bacterium]MCK5436546.1 hypothetical protein [Desulfobulbaceae bacterium]
MKKILKKFQDFMVAATFVEAGEWDTGGEIVPDIELSRELTWADKIFMASHDFLRAHQC